MTFASFIIQLLNGLASASSLFLVSAGLSLIFGVTRIVNFAHGSFTMLGAYIAVTLYDRLGGGALGLAWLTLVLAPAWGWALLACYLSGVGYYALHNTLQTNATQMAPRVRGTAVSR